MFTVLWIFKVDDYCIQKNATLKNQNNKNHVVFILKFKHMYNNMYYQPTKLLYYLIMRNNFYHSVTIFILNDELSKMLDLCCACLNYRDKIMWCNICIVSRYYKFITISFIDPLLQIKIKCWMKINLILIYIYIVNIYL